MIENNPDIPPAFLLIQNEIKGCNTPQEARKRIKGMLRDLRDQSEVFQLESLERKAYSPNPLQFDIHMHGSLDLLSGDGCAELPCRIKAADNIARSVGLIADHVWITDLLSEQFVDFGRATNAKLDKVLDDVLVLSRLSPLIHAGIVKFRAPVIATCRDCAMEFEKQVQIASQEIYKTFRQDFKIKKLDNESFEINTGKCFSPPINWYGQVNERTPMPSLKEAAELTIADQVRSAFWVAREASISGGSVFSNSRIGLSGLLQKEGRLPNRRAMLLADKDREFEVPWVSELDASQIVQLRQEAGNALPAFREQLSKALSSSNSNQNNSVDSLISELREQSYAVRSELESMRNNSSRYWKCTYGLLGLGLSAYGASTDQAIAGIAGLLPVLQLLIDHKTGDEKEIARLMSRPGYVLVKAQDILAHAQ